MAQTILVVDDDPVQRRLLEAAISRGGMNVVTAPGGQPALDLINGPRGDQITLMLLDLVMPDMDGLEVLTKLRATNPDLPVIVLTAKGGIDSAVEAMRAGANDFLVKPASPERIAVSIRNQLKIGTLSGEVKHLKKKQDNKLTFDDLIATSLEMKQVFRLGTRAAQSEIPVLIEGESGAGKELIARAIQGTSARAGRPFVTVNCGAIPENLIESILFGHEKGSFTGANDKHLGKFQEADGGTLFLDEIGEVRLDMQVKLLRALQEGEVDPVGSKRPVKVDVRIIAATNRDLGAMVREGVFREDLYYRLNVINIHIPPLRERGQDILPMAEYLMKRHATPGTALPVITPDLKRTMMTYSWPGNVRELENVVRKLLILGDADLIARELQGKTTRRALLASSKMENSTRPASNDYAVSDSPILEQVTKAKHLAETDAILAALNATRWNRKQAAALLKVDYKALLYKMKKLGVESGPPTSDPAEAVSPKKMAAGGD